MSRLEELLTPRELSEALDVGRGTIYKWARSGILPYVRLGRVIRFRASDVERILSSEGAKKNGTAS